MRNIRVLILEEDRAYGQALCRQLSLGCTGFSVQVKDGTCMKQELLPSVDLLVLGEYGTCQAAEAAIAFFRKEGRCVELIRENPDGTAGGSFVQRYGSVSRLSSILTLVYGKVSGKKNSALDRRGSAVLTGFLSGTGCGGKGMAAMAFGRILSREEGKRVLYLTVEELESTGLSMNFTEGERSLGEFLYYLYSKEEKAAATYLDAFLVRDSYGVYTFYPSRFRNELSSLSEEELITLFQIILQYGEFDHLVLDLPCSFSQENTFLMRSCNTLILLYREDSHSLFLQQRLLTTLEDWARVGTENILSHCCFWETEGDGDRGPDIHGDLGREMKGLVQRIYGG